MKKYILEVPADNIEEYGIKMNASVFKILNLKGKLYLLLEKFRELEVSKEKKQQHSSVVEKLVKLQNFYELFEKNCRGFLAIQETDFRKTIQEMDGSDSKSIIRAATKELGKILADLNPNKSGWLNG